MREELKSALKVVDFRVNEYTDRYSANITHDRFSYERIQLRLAITLSLGGGREGDAHINASFEVKVPQRTLRLHQNLIGLRTVTRTSTLITRCGFKRIALRHVDVSKRDARGVRLNGIRAITKCRTGYASRSGTDELSKESAHRCNVAPPVTRIGRPARQTHTRVRARAHSQHSGNAPCTYDTVEEISRRRKR